MSFARDVYTAGAAATDFTITYAYEQEADVLVTVDGTLKTAVTDYSFPDATTIRFVVAMTGGETVVLTRSTSQDTRNVTFVAGVFTSEDLNDSVVQNFYMAQEAIDKAALALGVDTDDNWAGQAKRLKDIAEPTAGTDAVTKDYADALATGTLGSPISIANGGTASATASAARTALGLAIDTDVPSQASFDALNVLTTRGDLLVRGATVPERIAVGTATHVLTSDGTDSAWAVLPTAGDALAGILETATAAEQETGTAVDKIVTPGRQHSHVSAAKAWIVGAYSGGTPTDSASYNIASMDDDGTGLIGMHFTNAFSSANFPVAVTSESSAGVNNDSGVNTSVARSTTTVDIQIRVGSAANDAPFNMICVGDQ